MERVVDTTAQPVIPSPVVAKSKKRKSVDTSSPGEPDDATQGKRGKRVREIN